MALALEVSSRRLMILSNSPGLGSLGIFKDWAIHTPPETEEGGGKAKGGTDCIIYFRFTDLHFPFCFNINFTLGSACKHFRNYSKHSVSRPLTKALTLRTSSQLWDKGKSKWLVNMAAEKESKIFTKVREETRTKRKIVLAVQYNLPLQKIQDKKHLKRLNKNWQVRAD